MREIIINTLTKIWPTLLLITIIIVLTRILYLLINKRKRKIIREITILLFIIYIIFLGFLVTVEDSNYGVHNIVPFTEIFRYKIGSDLFYINTIGNILLFIPLGLFYKSILKNKKNIFSITLIIIMSIIIESFQYFIGRTFDIDDIILNVFGGLIGVIIYNILRSIFKRRSK